MKNTKKYLWILGLVLVLLMFVSVLRNPTEETPTPSQDPTPEVIEPEEDPKPDAVEPTEPVEEKLDEHGTYDSKDEVALYIHTYGHLPDNFMTKAEARKLGWSSGALNQVVEGKCIGGDVYSNYEGNLPKISGKYYECDIDTLHEKKRGAKRIVFSDNGDIYYTDDHYETFEQLYEGGNP